MSQSSEAVKLFNGLNSIGQQFCVECIEATTACLSDPSHAVDRARTTHVRAARNAVEGTLELQLDCVRGWQRSLPEEAGVGSTPYAALAAAESAIEVRSALWAAWFDSLELVNRRGMDAVADVADSRKSPAAKAQPPAQSDDTSQHREKAEETRGKSHRQAASERHVNVASS